MQHRHGFIFRCFQNKVSYDIMTQILFLEESMKRIVTLQDISCVGKCALTVALPVISAMGVETAVIPTALLSAHSVFPDFTFMDLTDQIEAISKHWKTQNLKFDAIYTGYLGSKHQIEVVSRFFDEFKTEDNFIFVDPAMADQGRLYTGFDMDFARTMTKLCEKADIIDPNITEACFMTGMEYRETYDERYVRKLMGRLADLGAKTVVLTGVTLEPGKTGVVGMDTSNGKMYHYFHPHVKGQFHGTGDIFSSSVIGALMNGRSLDESLRISANFTYECIRQTIMDESSSWYGVSFERALPYLIDQLRDDTNGSLRF